MSPDERLTAAENTVDDINYPPTEPNSACVNALIAIGRYLQAINNRQAQQAGE